MKFEPKSFLYMLIIPFLLSITGCIDLPTDLKVPQWNVDLNIPIVTKSYTLDDIIKKQNYISAQGDSIYLIQSGTYSLSSGIASFVQLNTSASLTNQIIPLGNLGITLYLPFPENAKPTAAVFKSGSLSFSIVNPNNADVSVLVSYPGIYKSDGSMLNISITIPANQSVTSKTNLAGCIYKLPANQQTQNQSSIQMMASTISNLPILSTINADFYCSDINFSSLTGYLPSKSVGTNMQSFALNLGNASDYGNKASLKYGSLNLSIKYNSANTSPFGFELKNLSITGERADGSRFSLKDSTDNSLMDLKINKAATTINFTESNSNINSFISFLPDKIILSAEYILNPDNTEGTVSDGDSVVFAADFSTRSVLSLQKSSITDTTGISISDSDTLKIKDAKSAYINVNVQNGIPLDTWLKITFTDSLYHPLFTLTNNSNSDSIYFSGASVDSKGVVTNPAISNDMVKLNSDQTTLLARAKYVIYTVTVQTSGATAGSGNYVEIRPDDNIKINVYGGINYKINTDDLK